MDVEALKDLEVPCLLLQVTEPFALRLLVLGQFVVLFLSLLELLFQLVDYLVLVGDLEVRSLDLLLEDLLPILSFRQFVP